MTDICVASITYIGLKCMEPNPGAGRAFRTRATRPDYRPRNKARTRLDEDVARSRLDRCDAGARSLSSPSLRPDDQTPLYLGGELVEPQLDIGIAAGAIDTVGVRRELQGTGIPRQYRPPADLARAVDDPPGP